MRALPLLALCLVLALALAVAWLSQGTGNRAAEPIRQPGTAAIVPEDELQRPLPVEAVAARDEMEAAEPLTSAPALAALDVQVLDPNGAPSPGTRVLVHAMAEKRTAGDARTGPEGSVAFDSLHAGRHVVQALGADPPGFVRAVFSSAPQDASAAAVDLIEGQRAQVQLVRPGKGGVSGCIREAGVPLKGAEVSYSFSSILEGGGGASRTDAQGCFSLMSKSAGVYKVQVSHPTRCLVEEFEVEVVEGDVVVDRDLSVALIEGRVLGPGGESLPGALVWLSIDLEGAELEQRTAHVVCDADGNYRLRGLPPGRNLRINVNHPEYRPACSGPHRLAAEEVRMVNLQLRSAGKLQLAVTASDGTEAVRARIRAVYVDDTNEPIAPVVAETEAGGWALLTGLAPGRWSIEVVGRNGDERAQQAVTIVAGGLEQLALELRPDR